MTYPQLVLQLLDTKSTDRKMTLLHFIALTVREKYPELATFWQELHFVEKAAAGAPPRPHAPSLPSPGAVGPLTHPCGPAVSLENVLLDVKELGRGMELLRRECGLHENSVLRSFLAASEGKLERLQKDARTAEVRAAERRCLARPLHTRCHARLALHSCLACLALHAPCALMPCFAHSSCTPALLCTLLVHALLCTALVHILLRAALVHALLYTLLMHACSALHAPRARLSLHTPRARRPPGAAGCAARR